MKTVRDILIQAIRAAGGDGLCRNECGCSVKDLAPCGSISENCVIAKDVGPKNGCEHYFEPLVESTPDKTSVDEKSCGEECANRAYKCYEVCKDFSRWKPREKREQSDIQKLMPLLEAIVEHLKYTQLVPSAPTQVIRAPEAELAKMEGGK
jgi:hypothetical protein